MESVFTCSIIGQDDQKLMLREDVQKLILRVLPKKTSSDKDLFVPRPKKPRKLCFSNVHIREFSRIPGINPAGRRGVPITISWDPISSIDISIDQYECIRQKHRRSMKEINLSPSRRTGLLRELGFSKNEIQKAVKQANLVRSRRENTLATLEYQKMHEHMEAIKRFLLNAVSFGQKKKKKREFLMRHCPTHYDQAHNCSTPQHNIDAT
jgi:hypothetical protein